MIMMTKQHIPTNSALFNSSPKRLNTTKLVSFIYFRFYHDPRQGIFLLVTQPMWICIFLVRGIKIPLKNWKDGENGDDYDDGENYDDIHNYDDFPEQGPG